MTTLLLYPPAVKPAEPPLGVAVLLGHLRSQGLAASAIDANLEAYLFLLEPQRLALAAGMAPATAVKRALGQLPGLLQRLRSPAILASPARYQTGVRQLQTALSVYGADRGQRLSLGDYSHAGLSEYVPADLARLAAGEQSTLFGDYFRQRLLPRIAHHPPRLIAFSVNYRHQLLPTFELAGLLARQFPGIPLVAGGGMITSWRASLRQLDLRLPPFTHLIFGPGEEPLARLAAGPRPQEYFLEGSQIAFAPDFSFAPLTDYLSPVPVLPVSAARGCYWGRCRFCPEATAPTHPYAASGPGAFIALLLQLRRDTGIHHFHFTDNALPLSILRELAGRWQELRELRWHGFVRFEAALLEPDLLPGLAKAGCTMLQLGLESGSQPVLDRLGKGTRLEQAAQILEQMRQAGIAAYVYVMFGMPGETEADAELTLAFLRQHAAAIGFLNLAIMNLPRDSTLAAPGAAAPLLDDAAPLGLYRSFAAEDGWGRAAARRFLHQRVLALPEIRAIVKRTPPWFTSNHAFLFPPPGGVC